MRALTVQNVNNNLVSYYKHFIIINNNIQYRPADCVKHKKYIVWV